MLALLVPGARHGYDLKRAHDEWFAGMRPLAYGQVYSTLARLQRDGLVEVAHTESGEGPERVVYDITAGGRGRVRAWFAQPVEPGGSSAEELLRKTLAAWRLAADPDALVARQREAHLRRLRALDDAGSTPDLACALLIDQTRLHLDADLRWLDLAAARMRSQPRPAGPGLRDRELPRTTDTPPRATDDATEGVLP